MAGKAIDVYLNDHLAGAMFGSDLAAQIHERNEGTAIGDAMGPIAREIEADRQTLIDLMSRMGTSRNPVKQASTWLAEKVSRAKFSGRIIGSPEFGTFMALETLALGVAGKIALWRALKEVAGDHERLASIDLDSLIDRGEAQRGTIEGLRLIAAKRALPG